MRPVYRFEENAEYWDRRWDEAVRDSDTFDDLTIYPIRYAEMVMSNGGNAVELGCGLGRILKHYASHGRVVVGIERSKVAVERLHLENPELDVRIGDVTGLPFSDGEFDIAMAFGVFHNLETGIQEALLETRRVLKPGARFCISMRPDNIEMRLNEIYWRQHNRDRSCGEKRFHKMLVGESEFTNMLRIAKLETDQVHKARNVSILYRLPFLRAAETESGEEKTLRSRGYRLNAFGRTLEGFLRFAFLYHTANVLVFIGRAV